MKEEKVFKEKAERNFLKTRGVKKSQGRGQREKKDWETKTGGNSSEKDTFVKEGFGEREKESTSWGVKEKKGGEVRARRDRAVT